MGGIDKSFILNHFFFIDSVQLRSKLHGLSSVSRSIKELISLSDPLRPTVGAFQMWADKIQDQDWTWEHVLPFYKKSVNFSPPDYTKINPAYNITYEDSALTPAGGPLQVSYGNHMYDYGLAFQNGFDKIGIHAIPGLNSGQLIGYAPFTGTIDPTAATRSSSETSFLEMAMQSTGLKIYQTTTVKQVLFDENKRATGVRVQMQGIYPQYEYMLSARREVIVSAGAVSFSWVCIGLCSKHISSILHNFSWSLALDPRQASKTSTSPSCKRPRASARICGLVPSIVNFGNTSKSFRINRGSVLLGKVSMKQKHR